MKCSNAKKNIEANPDPFSHITLKLGQLTLVINLFCFIHEKYNWSGFGICIGLDTV